MLDSTNGKSSHNTIKLKSSHCTQSESEIPENIGFFSDHRVVLDSSWLLMWYDILTLILQLAEHFS